MCHKVFFFKSLLFIYFFAILGYFSHMSVFFSVYTVLCNRASYSNISRDSAVFSNFFKSEKTSNKLKRRSWSFQFRFCFTEAKRFREQGGRGVANGRPLYKCEGVFTRRPNAQTSQTEERGAKGYAFLRIICWILFAPACLFVATSELKKDWTAAVITTKRWAFFF